MLTSSPTSPPIRHLPSSHPPTSSLSTSIDAETEALRAASQAAVREADLQAEKERQLRAKIGDGAVGGIVKGATKSERLRLAEGRTTAGGGTGIGEEWKPEGWTGGIAKRRG